MELAGIMSEVLSEEQRKAQVKNFQCLPYMSVKTPETANFFKSLGPDFELMLSNDRITFSRKHPTLKTVSLGYSGLYGGTSGLEGATLQEFLLLEAEKDPQIAKLLEGLHTNSRTQFQKGEYITQEETLDFMCAHEVLDGFASASYAIGGCPQQP